MYQQSEEIKYPQIYFIFLNKITYNDQE